MFATVLLAWAAADASAQTLVWNPNPETNISGYRVYQGTTSGVYPVQVNVGNTTSYPPQGVDWSKRAYFALKAINTSGLESPLSAEVVWTPASVTTVTALTSSLPYPLAPGTPVTWTATASNNLGPVEYRFWMYKKSFWVLARDYGPSNTLTWTPQAADQGAPYSVQVWVRAVGSTAVYEALRSTSTTFAVSPPPLQLLADVEFPTPAGNQVTWTAKAASTEPLEYRFRVLDQSTSTWTVFRDYAPSNRAHWKPQASGAYVVQAFARPIGGTLEVSAVTPMLSVTPSAVTVKALWADTSFPASTGTRITWTALVQGGLAGPLQYQFWLHSSLTGWKNVQPYGPSNTFTWTPGWGDDATYWLQVWVRSSGSNAVYEHLRSTTSSFQIQPASIHLTSPTLFPAAPGNPVIWTASGPDPAANLEYQFNVHSSATNQWSLGQAYGPQNTFTWSPGSGGAYRVQVWARQVGSSSSFQLQRTSDLLSIAPEPAFMQALTSSVALPAHAGTSITWTAAASGGTASLEYQFWRQDGSNWILAQDYSPSNSYTWFTTGGSVGQHQIQVRARSIGSSQAFESQMMTGVFSIQ